MFCSVNAVWLGGTHILSAIKCSAHSPVKRKVIKRERTIFQIQPPKRVAAYARVSSGKEQMLHSLAAQAEIERRKKLRRPLSCESVLSAKLVCGQCGGYYGPKVWGSNSKYRRVIWRCNDKYRGVSKCGTPHVTEEEVKQKFLEAFNSLAGYRREIVANCRFARETLCDYSEIDAELGELHREIEVVTELSRKAIHENAHAAISQAEWHERNNGYLERHRKAVKRARELEDLKRERQN